MLLSSSPPVPRLELRFAAERSYRQAKARMGLGGNHQNDGLSATTLDECGSKNAMRLVWC